jgi:hypothetical protein
MDRMILFEFALKKKFISVVINSNIGYNFKEGFFLNYNYFTIVQ